MEVQFPAVQSWEPATCGNIFKGLIWIHSRPSVTHVKAATPFCTIELGVIISVVYLALFSLYDKEGIAPPRKFYACLYVETIRRRWKDA